MNNTRGDVLELRKADGTLYCRYVYDSWGRLVSAKNASGNNLSASTIGYQNSIRYRGYVYDHETGLYYLQSRYYDPETGRFLNADDAEYIGYSGGQLSYNAFAYCENNAVNDSDVYGNFPWKEITETFEKIFDYIDETCDFLLEKYGLSNKKYKKLTKYKSPSSILKYVNKNKKKCFLNGGAYENSERN